MEIKFVSYSGEYPCLCSGTLILEIENKKYFFSDSHLKGDNCFCAFWESGGKVWFSKDWEDHIVRRKWKLNSKALPDFLKPYGKQLIAIFNKNVPHGCCGGCI